MYNSLIVYNSTFLIKNIENNIEIIIHFTVLCVITIFKTNIQQIYNK